MSFIGFIGICYSDRIIIINNNNESKKKKSINKYHYNNIEP